MKGKPVNLGKIKRADIGSISEVNFGHNTMLDGYPHLTAEINKLDEAVAKNKGGEPCVNT